MKALRTLSLPLAGVICGVLASCGSAAPADVSTPTASAAAIPAPARGSRSRLTDWPEFGLDAQRSNVSEAATGITAANIARLHRFTVHLPGTIDSSPIYLHGVDVAGSAHDVILATSTYGRTFAIDAADGRTLWTFTPSSAAGLSGGPQITNTSPIADPLRAFVYAASPDGRIHKLSIRDGREATAGAWPATITRDATHEKLAAALNIAGAWLIATTGGYIGDGPTYQGHVVLIDRASGRIQRIFNTLCANRRELLLPRSCPSSDSAVLSRGGAVVEPSGARLLISTGNAPWNGTTDFGDSVLELTLPDLRLRQSFTPRNQAQLNSSDSDLGSSAPVLLGGDRVLVAGKDGVMRVLALSRLDGHPPSGARLHPLGGEVQRLSIPGGGQLFSSPAVWHRGAHTTVFLADAAGTAAYVLRGGRLYRAWENGNPGTSPVMAGGLLYVYDPSGGGIEVYRPGSAHAIAKLPGEAGHWNSPIVVDGHVVEPEGNANDHRSSGTLDVFSTG